MKRQAFASWRWYNYTSSQAASDKQLLRLNIDETSVSLYQGGKKGNVFISKAVKSKGRVPLWKRRCSLTHVAVVCDQPHIQPRLLQTLVGNWSAFPQKAMAGLRAKSPPNVLLVRQRSAWNNQDLMALLIRMTGRILAMHAAGYQPVLLLDAARIHCTRKVLSAARAAGIWVVLTPAKTTWLLQPLETHGFARYKEYLQKRYQDARIEHGVTSLYRCSSSACMIRLDVYCRAPAGLQRLTRTGIALNRRTSQDVFRKPWALLEWLALRCRGLAKQT